MKEAESGQIEIVREKAKLKAEIMREFFALSQLLNQPDSIELGTPSKGGAIKIYGDFNKIDDFKKKVDNAKQIKEYANLQLKGE